MFDRRPSLRILKRPAAAALLLAAAQLGGCAGLGDGALSGAFVDPAKYDLYDCKRLEAERVGLAARSKDLQALIDKAQTGTGGAVMGELAYRNDYIAVRAQAKLAEETWEKNRCVATPPPEPPAPAPAPRKRGR